MNNFDPTKEQNEKGEIFFNLGIGEDLSIKELVSIISKVTDFNGEIIWNTNRPDGMEQKLLDVSKIHSLGWKHKVDLEEGVRQTYKWYIDNLRDLKI